MSLKNSFDSKDIVIKKGGDPWGGITKEGGEDWVTNEGTDLGSTERIITPVGPGI